MSYYVSDRDRSNVGAIALLLMRMKKKERKRLRTRRSCWIKKWRLDRHLTGSFHFLSNELKFEWMADYKNYLRMSNENFDIILELIRSDVTLQDTSMRLAITAEEQLCLTLRYLATGESYISLNYQTRLSTSFISKCIPRVCEALWKNMKGAYLKFPTTPGEWEHIAAAFERKWQFPLCLGALDGKHINFTAPKEAGSFYRNYKGTDSIVLLGLADANCKFIYVDIGANGRTNDAGVLKHSSLQAIIDNGSDYFPPEKAIGNDRTLPYVIVADSAFALNKYLLKPFSHRTGIEERLMYNKRLSRARHVIERAFGIMATRFRILQKPINVRKVEQIRNITKACCVLHNFLIENSQLYGLTTVETVATAAPDHTIAETSTSLATFANAIRTEYMQYFNNEGKLSWMSV